MPQRDVMTTGSVATHARAVSVPGVCRVVATTLAEAPPRVRRVAMMMGGNWLLLVVLQLIADFNSANRAYESLELAGVVLGSGGGMLLMMIYVLHASAQQAATAHNGAPAAGMVFTRMVVALPVFAAIGALMLIAAFVTYITRALLVTGGDVAFLLAIAVMLAAGAVFAMRLINDSVNFLHRYAAEQSELAAAATLHASQAELRALQAQMNPHFLFNALNTVAALVRTDARAAEQTVEHLADVLRRTLDRSRSTHGTVRDEIEYLRSYLAVEQQRWGERLVIEWSVDDAALGRSLPPLSLQPLVENALQHGIGARRAGGRVRITGRVEPHNVLLLSVSDDGEGFPARTREGTGIGNLRRRLKTLYGERATIDIDSSAHGATITLRIPAALEPNA